MPPKAHALRDGRLVSVMARELVPGDIVHIGVGDRYVRAYDHIVRCMLAGWPFLTDRLAVLQPDSVPADCRVLSCTDLLVDESSLTGEALPAEKTSALLLFSNSSSSGASGPAVASERTQPDGVPPPPSSSPEGEQHEIPLAERTNMVFLGTLVCNGHGKALVVGTGMKSEFGRTFAEMRDMEGRRTPLQAKMDTLAKQVRAERVGVVVEMNSPLHPSHPHTYTRSRWPPSSSSRSSGSSASCRARSS